MRNIAPLVTVRHGYSSTMPPATVCLVDGRRQAGTSSYNGLRDMRRIEKTVFISYRRANVPWALAIFQNLTNHGYDVFFDYNGIASGDFERVIIDNIVSRAHFLVLLTPSALDRCRDLTCPR